MTRHVSTSRPSRKARTDNAQTAYESGFLKSVNEELEVIRQGMHLVGRDSGTDDSVTGANDELLMPGVIGPMNPPSLVLEGTSSSTALDIQGERLGTPVALTSPLSQDHP
jgi:hypothetical protein